MYHHVGLGCKVLFSYLVTYQIVDISQLVLTPEYQTGEKHIGPIPAIAVSQSHSSAPVLWLGSGMLPQAHA
jgi:hypothetical protein